eukprot:SAG31_NODE_3913_length_3756_cov_1.959256_1_plen_25_part_10
MSELWRIAVHGDRDDYHVALACEND